MPCSNTTPGLQAFIIENAMVLITYLLICLAVFMYLPGRSAGQQQGFESINCGGRNFIDNSTGIQWMSNNDLVVHGNYTREIEASLKNMTSEQLRTLRFFPEDPRNNKFCYSLTVFNTTPYIVRASFLYGNYDGLNHPPSFVLLLNYDVWVPNVTTTTSIEPTVHEIMYISFQDTVSICLAPHSNGDTPFISTLELRPLNSSMYTVDGLNSGYGLLLKHRINYGAATSNAIRYPDDEFDRIWEANTTGPILSANPNTISTSTIADQEGPPPKVMATAITTNNYTENLTFVFQDLDGTGTLYIELHCQLVESVVQRTFNVTLPGIAKAIDPVTPVPAASTSVPIDVQTQLPSPFQVTLVLSANSVYGPLLNAIELLRRTDKPLSTTGTSAEDLIALKNVQTAFNLMGDGDGDPCVPKDYKWSWVVCSNDSMPRIIEINLTSYDITGTIPSSMNDLLELQKIDLSNNMLDGSIPDLSSLVNLKSLILDNNNLCGTIPSFLSKKNITFTYDANPNLCKDKCTCNQSSLAASNGRIYIYIISCLVALFILSMLVVFIRTRKVKKKSSITTTTGSTQRGRNNIDDVIFITKNFSYDEISNATTQFTTNIGEGGFGKVFHGVLQNGDVVAVKMLSNASKQGQKEFSTEIAILSRVHHKNLVSLLGYCIDNKCMLIYEYLSKGNLRDLLYGEVESIDRPLPWRTRLQIALDASQGLEYLHMGSDPTIIHRDVKSSNILLNDKMQAKVADFGLSRLKMGNSTVSHVSTINVVGTVGYLDPAYNATNQLTDKSDVYSFGIVLFELICGRPPIDVFNIPSHIVAWVREAIMRGTIGDIVDPLLMNGYKPESMWKVIDIAFGSVDRDRSKRPSMSEVVHVLREAVKIEMDNTPAPSTDVSGSSATSEGRAPVLRHIESLRLEPR